MRRLVAAWLVGLAAGCAGPAPAPPAAEPAFVAAREATPAGACCDACGERLADPAWRWPDGRRACEGCRGEAVTRLVDAEALLSLARDDLRRVVGLEAPAAATLRLELVDAPALARWAGRLAHPRLQALTVAPDASGDDDEGRTTILVLRGLPRPALRGVLAHELVHAAQIQGGATRPGPDGASPDPAWLEGSALWVHARVLRDEEGGAGRELPARPEAVDSPGDAGDGGGRGAGQEPRRRLRPGGAKAWAARLADPDDPETGGAMRRFELVVQALGQGPALRLATTTPRFPAGHQRAP